MGVRLLQKRSHHLGSDVKHADRVRQKILVDPRLHISDPNSPCACQPEGSLIISVPYVGSENSIIESEGIRDMVDPALLTNLPPLVSEHVFLTVVPGPQEAYVLCTAETAECTCPEFCERDHDRD